MNRWTVYAIVCVFGTLAALAWADYRVAKHEAAWRIERGKLQAKYAEAASSVRVDSVEVVKWATKTRTVRDSLLVQITDTLLVKSFIYQTDTLRTACLACTASASQLRTVADSLNHVNDSLIRALTPSKWEKARPWVFGIGGLVLGAYIRGGGR
jgi:hypothetical protein